MTITSKNFKNLESWFIYDALVNGSPVTTTSIISTEDPDRDVCMEGVADQITTLRVLHTNLQVHGNPILLDIGSGAFKAWVMVSY